jgi:hypothetical protein
VDAVSVALADHAGFLSRIVDTQSARSGWVHVTRMVRDGERAERGVDLTVPAAWERHVALQGWETEEELPEDELSPHGPGSAGTAGAPHR